MTPTPILRPTTTRLPLYAALLALVAALALGSTSSAAAAMTKGLEDDRMVLSDDPAVRQTSWAHAADAKVKTVRVLARWDGNASTVPDDQIQRLRRAAVEGNAVGARLMVGIYHGIGRGKPRSFRVRSAQSSAYIAFARSLAGGLQDLPIGSYLTWNEPNYKTTWPQAQAREWVRVSNATYAAFRSADPNVPIYAGEAAPETRTKNGSTMPGAFFRKALCLTKKYRSASRRASCRKTRLRTDGFTLHTYDFTRAPTKRTRNADQWTHGNLRSAIRQIKRFAKAKRISKKAARNVHVTEFAYRTQGRHATRASRAARWLKSAWRSARRAGVRSFTWYQLQDPPEVNTDWASGMISRSGTTRATWSVFRTLR